MKLWAVELRTRFLLAIWRRFPTWLQRLAALLVRPRFQVAVAAVILNQGGQLLLCEHTYRREHPWGLPGGDLKFAESPEAAVVREVKEETGLDVGAAKLLYVENSTRYRHLGLIYACEVRGGAFQANPEVSAIRYFDLDALPDLHPDERTMVDWIVRSKVV